MANTITFNVETITPALALAYLKTSVGNPRFANKKMVDEKKVNEYAEYMKNGEWALTGEPIKFDICGNLKDGHHRLSAVAKSNTAQVLPVVRGVPLEADKYMDTGKARNPVHMMLNYCDDIPDKIKHNSIIGIAPIIYGKGCSPREKELFLRNNSDILLKVYDICRKGDHNTSITATSAFMHGTMMALKCGESEEYLEKFAKVVRTGIYDSQEETSAIYLRNFILSNPHMTRVLEDRRRISALVQFAICEYCNGVIRKKGYTLKKAIPVYENEFKQGEIKWH